MGFFAVCEFCWQNKPLSDIEEATRKLHEDRLKRGIDRDLNEMIEETRKEYDLQNRH